MYGGGGHAMAAGAKLESWDCLKQFVKDTNNYIKENNQ
ncbi:protein containing Phosphoesterase, DHHA1 domain protein [gut metagenome]|uniref:Protein containing Phosphoesterase, DHHA1 domain protein n=1 Tax=gut metagenome TaxID=749906 RepID=J9FUJ5_9ZZZZ